MKPAVGTQYFTFWQTGLAGPFTYNGGDNYCFQSFIIGDVDRLLLAKDGFDFMFKNMWTLDESRNFAEQIHEVFADELVDAALLSASDWYVTECLLALKECAPLIRKVVGGPRGS